MTAQDQPQLTRLTLAPDTVLGGATSQGIVRLDIPAPADGITVHLDSSSPNVALPERTQVTVPKGSRTRAFTVNTRPVSTKTSVRITASHQNVRKVVALIVQQPAIQTFFFDPSFIPFGELSRGRIKLNGPAPSNTSVSLSGGTGTVEFPDGRTVWVLPEAMQVTFEAKGIAFTGDPRKVTITASYLEGGTNKADVTVEGLPT